MNKTKLHFTLLMAIVMMAMSPSTMWATTGNLEVKDGENITISGEYAYLDNVYVNSGGTLTIKEGATLRASKGLDVFGTLIVETGAKVNANNECCVYGSLNLKEGSQMSSTVDIEVYRNATLTIEDGAVILCYRNVSLKGTTTIEKGGSLLCTYDVYIHSGKTTNFGTIKSYEGAIEIKENADKCFSNQGVVNGKVTASSEWYNTGTVTGDYDSSTVITCEHSNKTTETVSPVTCTRGGYTKYTCTDCGLITYSTPALGHWLTVDYTNGIKRCQRDGCDHEEFQEPEKDGDTYLIANLGNLCWFSNFVSICDMGEYIIHPNASTNARLTADIMFNDGIFAADGTFTANGQTSTPRVWHAIGVDKMEFYYSGTFDGDSHTINGLYSKDRYEDSFGLFSKCGGAATIKGVGVVNCYFNCIGSNASGICSHNSGTISNCYSTGTISLSKGTSSGICYANYGTISNCYSSCSLSSPEYALVGGICANNSGTIKNSYFNGSLCDITWKGGICAYNQEYGSSPCIISNCYTTNATTVYKNEGNTTVIEVHGETDAQLFASGVIAYKLNGSVDNYGTWSEGTTEGSQAWYQRIPTAGSTQTNVLYDAFPVLKKAADGSNTVYYGYENCGAKEKIYSNNTLYPSIVHAFTGKTLSAEADSKTGLYDCLCDQCGSLDENKFIKDFAPKAEGVAKNLKLLPTRHTTNVEFTTSELINLTDDNQFKDLKNVSFTTPDYPTYTRTMSNKWGTFVLPFNISNPKSFDKTPYDIYELSSVSSDELTLTKATGAALVAGTPYFIRMSEESKNPETGKYELTIKASSKRITVTTGTGSSADGLTLTGTFALADVTDGYIISNNAFWNAASLKANDELWNDGNSEEAKANRHVYNAAFRAYLAGSISSGAKMLSIATDDDDTTAIETLNALSTAEGCGEVYDINGRRLNDLQQGINIVKRGNKTYKVIIK